MLYTLLILLFLIIIITLIVTYFMYKHQKLPYTHPKLDFNTKDIPPIIYKTGPKKYKNLPRELINNFKEIELENPNYKIKYYDDDMCRSFIKKNFNEKILKTYDCLVPGSYKADLFRYCLLYVNGGIYGDLSQQYLVPMDKLVDREKDRLVLVSDEFDILCLKNGVQISFMAAVPRLSIFKDAINKVVYNVKHKKYGCSFLSPTGPNLFRKCLDKTRTKYRMELEQKGSKLCNMKTGKPMIITKMKNHDVFINQTLKSRYFTKWWSGQIYNI